MRRLALLALLCACDDRADPATPGDMPSADMTSTDMPPTDMPPTDMRRLDQALDARPIDMQIADAHVDRDGALDMPGDAVVQDGGGQDATADMPAPGCIATVVVDDFEIFQFEASRVDATPESGGADATGVCSRAGVLPWVDVDLAGARAACATAGFSVCSAAQWQQACVGPELWPYPYGPGYVAGTCNDHVAGSGALEICGARPDCAGPTGIHDQNGNVWELTDDGQRRGASFKLTASMFRPEAGACEAGFVVAEGFFGRDVGFRCCR